MIDDELLKILVCPESKVPVERMPADRLQTLNERVRAGEIETVGGDRVSKPFEEALITRDGKRVYRVDDGIPIMLIDEAVDLS